MEKPKLTPLKACPRCQTPLSRADQKACTNCGLWFVCRSCGSMLTDPLRKFCDSCNAPIVQPPWAEAQPDQTGVQPAIASAADTTAPSVKPSISPAAPAGQNLPRPLQTWFSKYPVKLSLRNLYLDLGLGLAQAGRKGEAASAFEKALAEPASKRAQPKQAEVWLFLAHMYDQLADSQNAFRAFLEVVQCDPSQATAVLPYLQQFVTPAIALVSGKQLIEEWAPRIEGRLKTKAERMNFWLFLGRIHLFRAEYEDTILFFTQAAQASQQAAQQAAAPFFADASLPPALAGKDKDGVAHHLLARLYQALRMYTEAYQNIEIALEKGLPGTGSYPEAPLQELKAKLLFAMEKPEEASDWFYEAGRSYNWRNDGPKSAELLERSLELKPNRFEANWYLMDSLRMASYLPKPPYTLEEEIKASLVAWKAVPKDQQPDASLSWVFISRALVNERLAFLNPANRIGLWWEAILYLNRAILLQDLDSLRYVYLSRFHNNLQNDSSALQVTGKAIKINPEDEAAIEARGAILADIGAFSPALKMIKKRLQKDINNPWAKGVQSFILYHHGNPEEALRISNELVEQNDEDLWNLENRANCYRMLRQPDLAQKDYAAIVKICKDIADKWPDDQLTYGWAAFSTGDIELAVQIFETLILDPILAGAAYRNLGSCYLCQGKLEQAEEAFNQGIDLTTNVRELEELLTFDLWDLKAGLAGSPQLKLINKILTRVKARIQQRRKIVDLPRLEPDQALQAAIIEIMNVRQNRKPGDGNQDWTWFAMSAELARLYIEANQWEDAAAIYQLLINEPERFPEAHLGMEKAIDGIEQEAERQFADSKRDDAMALLRKAIGFAKLIPNPQKWLPFEQKLGDWLFKAGQLKDCLDQYTELLTFDPTLLGQAGLKIADIYAKIGYVQFRLENREDARHHFNRAIQHTLDQEHAQKPGQALGYACSSLVQDVLQYWALEEEWKSFASDPTTEPELAHDLTDARSTLANFLNQYFALSATAGGGEAKIPVATPIVLELGDKLIPADASQNWQNWTLFKTLIPEMRGRVIESIGIDLPGVRVRGNYGLPVNAYSILLHEVPVARGRVMLDRPFCIASRDQLKTLNIPDQAIFENYHPLSGQMGCWLPVEVREAALKQGVELWEDPLIYIMFHLEAAIRHHLATYLGAQEAANLVDRWSKDEKLSALIEATLRDQTSKIHFARLLRILVKDGIPLTDPQTIFTTLKDLPLTVENLPEAVKRVRVMLKRILPGNMPGVNRILLEPVWEEKISAWLHREGDRFQFDPPPEETTQLIFELNNRIASIEEEVALVVHQAELRPYVRRLIEPDLSDLPVLSQDELL